MPVRPTPRPLRTLGILVTAVAVMAACGRDPKPQPAPAPVAPPPQAVVPAPAPLGPDANGLAPTLTYAQAVDRSMMIRLEPYESVDHVYRHAESALQQSVRMVVQDSMDWSAAWRHIVGSGSIAPLPAVDFSREMLIVVAMGAMPCRGYGISVDTVMRDDAYRLFAVVRERKRGYRCGCLPDPVSPVDVIRVPRTIRPVTFLERTETNVCEER